MNLRTPLTVIETPEVKSPALYGFVRPRLVLPQGTLAAFTRQELHYIFLHELAHVKRCDMAVNWLISGLRVLHWFNPILWFGFRRMAADREVAADALALSRAPDGDPQPYGQTIIKLLESFTRPAVLPGLVGILEDKQQMKRRIAMIANSKKLRRGPPWHPCFCWRWVWSV
ncbi:MAG: M56 family metallopeptidase [Verrucomicrobia bacterium]|nr:M56 family metallopeptidase [Verrucomicrobiota bacterium]